MVLSISTTDKFIGSAKILAPFASIAKATFDVKEAEFNYLYNTLDLGEFTIKTTIDNASFVSAQCVEIEGAISIINESFTDSLFGILNCDRNIYFAELFNNSNDYIGKITLVENAFDINISTSIFKSRKARLLGNSIGFKIPLE